MIEAISACIPESKVVKVMVWSFSNWASASPEWRWT